MLNANPLEDPGEGAVEYEHCELEQVFFINLMGSVEELKSFIIEFKINMMHQLVEPAGR